MKCVIARSLRSLQLNRRGVLAVVNAVVFTWLSLTPAVPLSAQPRARVATAPPGPRGAFSNYEVVHESWSVADGLPVNSINQLLQSRDGYIWAATFDGLVRFDGVKFTVFNSANSPGLPSDRIIWMQEETGYHT